MANEDPKLRYDVTKLPQPRMPSDEYAIASLVEARATRLAIAELSKQLAKLIELTEQAQDSKKAKAK